MNDFLHLVDDIFESSWAIPAALVAAAALIVAAIVAPRRFPEARASYDDAEISPLWALGGAVVVLVAAFLSGYIPFLPELAAVGHLVLGGWILYRHRRWLWIHLPIVLLSVAGTIVFLGMSVMMGVWAQIGH